LLINNETFSFIINKFVTLVSTYFNIMHELSIALGIVKIAKKEVEKVDVKEVTKIELQIGTLSGVEITSLNYVWPSAVKDSVLENAEKNIEIIKAKGKCADCETEFEMKNIFDSCPKCHSHLKNILKGKELRVKALEVI